MLTMVFGSAIKTEHEPNERHELSALIERIAEGDKAALGDLYGHTADAVYAYALSVLHSAHDAEDVLHDTFIKVYSAAAGYTDHGKPMAWIITIAKNLALMKLRESGRITPTDPDEQTLCGIKAEGLSHDERLLLKAALSALTPSERQVVMLHAVAGLRHREIAAVTDMTLSGVLSKYSRAIKKLKAAMEAEI